MLILLFYLFLPHYRDQQKIINEKELALKAIEKNQWREFEKQLEKKRKCWIVNILKIARKTCMVKPGERIFIDINK